MAALAQRILSERPLNAEPAPGKLVQSYLTPPAATFHRNHGDPVQLPRSTYALRVSSEVSFVDTAAASSFTSDDLERNFHNKSVVTVLACAGNRRQKMSDEKETEGLQWGKSALSNTQFAGEPALHPGLSAPGFRPAEPSLDIVSQARSSVTCLLKLASS